MAISENLQHKAPTLSFVQHLFYALSDHENVCSSNMASEHNSDATNSSTLHSHLPTLDGNRSSNIQLHYCEHTDYRFLAVCANQDTIIDELPYFLSPAQNEDKLHLIVFQNTTLSLYSADNSNASKQTLALDHGSVLLHNQSVSALAFTMQKNSRLFVIELSKSQLTYMIPQAENLGFAKSNTQQFSQGTSPDYEFEPLSLEQSVRLQEILGGGYTQQDTDIVDQHVSSHRASHPTQHYSAQYIGAQSFAYALTILHSRVFEQQKYERMESVLEDHQRLQKARHILQQNFRNPPTLSELSKAIGINKNKLCKGFKQNFGMTIGDFVQHYRMQHAKQLLQLREHNIAYIAERVGYDHPGNFTAAYKRVFGELPKISRNKYAQA